MQFSQNKHMIILFQSPNKIDWGEGHKAISKRVNTRRICLYAFLVSLNVEQNFGSTGMK